MYAEDYLENYLNNILRYVCLIEKMDGSRERLSTTVGTIPAKFLASFSLFPGFDPMLLAPSSFLQLIFPFFSPKSVPACIRGAVRVGINKDKQCVGIVSDSPEVLNLITKGLY